MTIWRLVWRSAMHDRRALSGTFAGIVLAAMVLVGALIVGDSVRQTLRSAALARLGSIESAMITGDRFVRRELAEMIEQRDPALRLAPALQLQGIASTTDRSRRALNVVVCGVEARFFSMAPRSDTLPALRDGEALLSERLAAQLAVGPGETIVLRVSRPSTLSRDLTFAATDDAVLALRLTVAGVAGDAQFGRFSLTADQTPPFNLFVPLDWLARQAEQPGRANLLLAAFSGAADEPPGPSLDEHVKAVWTAADLGLEQRDSRADSLVEWRTPRVFFDAPIVRAAAEIEPRALGVLTYFVNEMRLGERATPYSTVAGIGSLSGESPLPEPWRAIVPDSLGDEEIILTRWAAEDLKAAAGDTVELTYFALEAGRMLAQRSATFRVAGVIDQTGPAADPDLMPDIPGLSDSADCRDWNPGIPINLERIRDKDEAYWDEFRGAPKAFITLAAAQKLWANRFGDLTAIRVPPDSPLSAESLMRRLDPASFGFSFAPVREAALAAANPTTDFGGLFIGLSLFLIASAALLAGLLFAFAVNRRARQVGTVLAVGWTPNTVRGWLAREALLVAVAGTIVGSALGVAYSALLLGALSSIWSRAVAGAALQPHISPMSIGLGAALALAAAMTAMHFAARTLLRERTLRLLQGELGSTDLAGRRKRGRLAPIGAATSLIGAGIALALGAQADRGGAVAAFFAGGALLLIFGILAVRLLLARMLRPGREAALSAWRLAAQSAARRPGRSTACIALLACGCFLVVAVGMNRLNPPEPGRRDSGTGGFALLAQSSIPLLVDLNDPAARQTLNFDAELLADVSFVPLRVRGGDEASCLNLNRAQQPRILGVDPRALSARRAFAFAAMLERDARHDPWLELTAPDHESSASDTNPRSPSPKPQTTEQIIPAIVDQASMMWAMHKGLGDIIWYESDRGERVGLQLVGALSNSILQGSLIISERDFERHFPSQSGHGMLLIDAPPQRAETVAAALTRSLEDVGLEVVSTVRRLAEFNAVQNTYLAVFQVLGGLGLIIGTAGLAMVVLRNVSDRRGELALLIAVGFTSKALRRLLLIEHGLLLLLGVACGVAAAIAAVWPAIQQSATAGSAATTLLIIALVLACGLFWVTLATRLALRGHLLDALRQE
ncbi:MAG: FtsX-like permease family protein [Phycisphaerales bacterium]|nr:FtsX-like permease family protein [Phycisphaerales bacterium]